MPERPEIPEAKDSFEKMVAISIATMAVVLSVVGNHGDHAKTEAIIKTTEASNRWAYFQSKSIKEHLAQTELSSLLVLSPQIMDPAKSHALLEKLPEQIKRYETEKEAIKAEAEALEKDAAKKLRITERSDAGTLLLQIAIVLSSVAILSKWKPSWFAGLLLGAAGAAMGLSAYLL